MGETKELIHEDAIAKMKKIGDGQMAMVCTFGGDQEMDTRPMGTLRIDDDGTFWFYSRSDSRKNRHVHENPDVHLIYAIAGKSEYMALEGWATVVRDRAMIDELWTPRASAWFHEGKDDPHLTLIKVTPLRGHYWDTLHGKVVQLAKKAVGALTGHPIDDEVEGNLEL